MKKLLLLLLVVAGAFASVPRLRALAQPVVAPGVDRVRDWLGPAVVAALEPVLRWSARNEAEQLLRMLRDDRFAGEPLPRPSRFAGYVQRNSDSGRGGHDPWGSPYYLDVTRDSIRVGSPGPDLERGTADDIVASMRRL